jgi:hypothetical protein
VVAIAVLLALGGVAWLLTRPKPPATIVTPPTVAAPVPTVAPPKPAEPEPVRITKPKKKPVLAPAKPEEGTNRAPIVE